jgi:hypothetical protein
LAVAALLASSSSSSSDHLSMPLSGVKFRSGPTEGGG